MTLRWRALVCALMLLAAGCGHSRFVGLGPPGSEAKAHPDLHGPPAFPTAAAGPASPARQVSDSAFEVFGAEAIAYGGERTRYGDNDPQQLAIVPGSSQGVAWARYSVPAPHSELPRTLEIYADDAAQYPSGPALLQSWYVAIANYSRMQWDLFGPFGGGDTPGYAHIVLNSADVRERYTSIAGRLEFALFTDPHGWNGLTMTHAMVSFGSTFQTTKPHVPKISTDFNAGAKTVTVNIAHYDPWPEEATDNGPLTFRILRSQDGALPKVLAEIDRTVLSFVDPRDDTFNVPPPQLGHTYAYSVQALNDVGASSPSEASKQVFTPATPVNFSVTYNAQNLTAQLAWEPYGNHDGFKVYRRLEGETEYTLIATLDEFADSLIDQQPDCLAYYYKVTEFAGVLESAPTEEKSGRLGFTPDANVTKLKPDTGYPGATVKFLPTIEDAPPNADYHWYFGDLATPAESDEKEPVVTLTQSEGVYPVSFRVSSCGGGSDSITVNFELTKAVTPVVYAMDVDKTTHHNIGDEPPAHLKAWCNVPVNEWQWTADGGSVSGQGQQAIWHPTYGLGRITVTCTAKTDAGNATRGIYLFSTAAPILTDLGDNGHFIDFTLPSSYQENAPYVPLSAYMPLGHGCTILSKFEIWQTFAVDHLALLRSIAGSSSTGNVVFINPEDDDYQMTNSWLTSQGTSQSQAFFLGDVVNPVWLPSGYQWSGPYTILIDPDGYIREAQSGQLSTEQYEWSQVAAQMFGTYDNGDGGGGGGPG